MGLENTFAGNFAGDPITDPQSWDTVQVAGQSLPFPCILSGWERESAWDEKQGKGAKGANSTYVSEKLCRGSIKFLLFKAGDYGLWMTYRQLFKYDTTKKPSQAIAIHHFSLDAIDVHAVNVAKVEAPIHEGQGLYSATVHLVEFAPPPPRSAVFTPTKAKTSSELGNTPAGNPQSDVDAQLQAQIGQLMTRAAQP